MNKMFKLKLAAVGTCLAMSSGMALAEETIKVGVLHSLSGTMAISETTLKDTVLMLVDEQNKREVCLVKAGSRCGRSSVELAVICRKSA